MVASRLRLVRAFTSFSDTRVVPNVKPVQFYWTVKDVSSYSQFLKWVDSTKVVQVHSDKKFDAEMTVNFKVYSDSFISTAVCETDHNREEYNIVSHSLNSSIFESMVSQWKVSRDPKGCKVAYSIDFEFNNMLYRSASGYFIGVIGKTTMNLFIERAKEMYEKDNLFKSIHSKSKEKESGEAASRGKGPEKAGRGKEEEECAFEFLVKKEDIEKEVLVFQTVDMLYKDGLLSYMESVAFKKLYFTRKQFTFEVKTLFDTFPSRQEILDNKDTVIFHLKSLIGYHSTEAKYNI